MKEVGRGGLQDRIIDSVKKQGGCAEKTNGAFKKGIADLIIKLPEYPAMIVEVKQHGRRCSTAPFKTALEPLQREFQRKFGTLTVTGVMWKDQLRLYVTTGHKEMIDPTRTPYVVWLNGMFDMRSLLCGALENALPMCINE